MRYINLFFLTIKNPLKIFIFIIIAFLLFLPACGYHFPGYGTSLPPDIVTISIPIFKNQTLVPSLENIVTDSVIKRFLMGGRLKVVNSGGDVLLIGNIRSFSENPISFNRDGIVIESRVSIVVDLTLKRKDNEQVLKKESLTETWVYGVVEDILTSEKKRFYSFKKIADDLADRIYDWTFEGF